MRLNTNNWLEALRVLVNSEHTAQIGGHIQPPGARGVKARGMKARVSWKAHEPLYPSLNRERKEWETQAPRGGASNFLVV